jgi:hypothetical protein
LSWAFDRIRKALAPAIFIRGGKIENYMGHFHENAVLMWEPISERRPFITHVNRRWGDMGPSIASHTPPKTAIFIRG